MSTEIINKDELARIAAAAPYQPSHGALLAALRRRYPEAELNLVSSGGPWSRGADVLVDREGRRLTEKSEEWLEAERGAAGGDLRLLWEKYRDLGLRRIEIEGETLIIAVPYGPDPDAFLQIEFTASREIADRYLFDASSPPETFEDLLFSSLLCEVPEEISARQYRFVRIINVRRFLHDMVRLEHERRLSVLPEMEKRKIVLVYLEEERPPETEEVPFLKLNPDWLDRPMGETRFIQDWRESSAGKGGYRLCDHWWLNIMDYLDRGRRRMGFVPYWAAEGGPLPKVDAGQFNSVRKLMEALDEFDRKAGYPFAWYFYMLHGNKITCRVGERVLEGVMHGLIGLPECDAGVLVRWGEWEYGF